MTTKGQELPVIDRLTTYNDIQLFPELYDTTTIIERVIGEADLIERQLRQPGMYPPPPPRTPLPSTSGFVPILMLYFDSREQNLA